MPSWPSRLLLGTSAPSNTFSGPGSPGPESPRKHGQHKTTSRGEAPTSAPKNASSGPNRDRPVIHGRSLSHPFTSCLNEDRPANRRVKGRDEFDGLENMGEDPSILPGIPREHILAGQTGSLQHGEKELATGKCATCGLLVRWPKNVDVFRCSVCLMVNDLKSASHREKIMGPELARKGKLCRQSSRYIV